MSLMDEDDDHLPGHGHHRELTLSTGTVLGIFLGLALSWALFFGFGYNMGAKARQAAMPVVENSSPAADTSSNFKSFKPSPASTADTYPAPAPQATTVPVINTPPPAQSPAPTNTTTPADPTAVTERPSPAPIHLAPVTPSAAASTPGPLGTFNVQVAAFSHPEDASMLVGALRKKGYAVAAVHNNVDNLTHVQIGPFNNRKEADSMRQQLLSDGYNAMVK
jgi:DedD protein